MLGIYDHSTKVVYAVYLWYSKRDRIGKSIQELHSEKCIRNVPVIGKHCDGIDIIKSSKIFAIEASPITFLLVR